MCEKYLLDFRECSEEDFKNALLSKDKPVEEISDEYLNILATKFVNDAAVCAYAGTIYSRGLSMDSKKRANTYIAELVKRGYTINF